MYVVGQMSFNYNILRNTAYWRQCELFMVFTSVYFSRWDLVTHVSSRAKRLASYRKIEKVPQAEHRKSRNEQKWIESGILCCKVSHERNGLEGGKKVVFAMTWIVLNILSFPVTILMNVLVIMAVKTRARLQSKYNILLACLSGTDLLVGTVSQPASIAGHIYVIQGLSLIELCRFHTETYALFVIPIISSLFHLTIISIDRFLAMKYTLRYETIVTKLRLRKAVVTSWFIACFPAFYNLSEKFEIVVRVASTLVGLFTLSLILFCHLSVYFVTRRHEKQIKCEQVSPQAAADFAKEKKALKTTRIIIMALLLCFLPVIVRYSFLPLYFKNSNYVLNVLVLSHSVIVTIPLLNSLCNPIIYCYRNKMFRKTCKELLKMNCKNFNKE